MEALDIKYDSIINNVSLVPVNTSKWQNILHSLKNVFSLKGEKDTMKISTLMAYAKVPTFFNFRFTSNIVICK